LGSTRSANPGHTAPTRRRVVLGVGLATYRRASPQPGSNSPTQQRQDMTGVRRAALFGQPHDFSDRNYVATAQSSASPDLSIRGVESDVLGRNVLAKQRRFNHHAVPGGHWETTWRRCRGRIRCDGMQRVHLLRKRKLVWRQLLDLDMGLRLGGFVQCDLPLACQSGVWRKGSGGSPAIVVAASYANTSTASCPADKTLTGGSCSWISHDGHSNWVYHQGYQSGNSWVCAGTLQWGTQGCYTWGSGFVCGRATAFCQ
jgi:hypothetical protein